MEITNQDWKLFRKLLPGWQEAYMERLTRKYTELLAEEREASDKFWALDKRIRQDKRSPGVQLELRRSDMLNALTGLLKDGVITLDDLEGFSNDLRETLHFLMGL